MSIDTGRWLGIINPVLFLSLLLQFGSGVLLVVVGSTGMFRIHLVNAVLLAGAVLAHIILNWGWIRSRFNIFFVDRRGEQRRQL